MIRTSPTKTKSNRLTPQTPSGTKRSVSKAKEELFAKEYLIDLNATRAAIRAGYSARSAHVIGYNLLKKVNVVSFIQRHMDARAKRTAITVDRVLEELSHIAFFNPKKLYDELGDLLPMAKLDDATARAIGSLEITENWNGRGKDAIAYLSKKLKSIDKKGALELCMKHLSMLTDKVDHTSSDGSMTPQKTVVVLPAKNEVPK